MIRQTWLPAHSFSHRPGIFRCRPLWSKMRFAANLVHVERQGHSHVLPLQVLCANYVCLSHLVCPRGIKHLMLNKPTLDCGHLSSAISGLEHLETLWLADHGVTPQASGALQLSAHQSLRSLALTHVVPESISCNDSCELHVKLGPESMEHPVWDTVLPRVRTVTLYGRSPRHPVALPSILLKAGNVTSAFVTVDQCGTADAPLLLGGSLAHVEDLVLRGLELHAIVPAHVTLRNVYVAATHLNLRFEAVASFGEAIPAFCCRFMEVQVCYSQPFLYVFMTIIPAPDLVYSIFPKGSALFELAAVVARRLPGWTGACSLDGHPSFGRPVTGGICFPLTQPPRMLYTALGQCRCGACADCLCTAGIMH